MENIPTGPGAIFIKSPKGRGKTELLSGIDPKWQASVLLIGHRRPPYIQKTIVLWTETCYKYWQSNTYFFVSTYLVPSIVL